MTEHTIVPILKSGDPMMLSNYRTIINGHYLAKLYGSILELELSIWAERIAAVQLDKQVFEKSSHIDPPSPYRVIWRGGSPLSSIVNRSLGLLQSYIFIG